MKKRIIAIIAAISLLTLAFSGCSSAKTAASASPSPAQASEAAQTTEAQATETSAEATTTASAEPVKITVAADAVPHTELLELVKPKLAEEGIDLEIVTLSGDAYATANEQTANGEFDANFFQHLPYLESVKSEKGYDLVSIGGIHVEPIGAYSTKYTSKDQLPDDSTIAIPNDATNEYRALKILEDNGFIKLSSSIQNYSATVADIEEYVKPITIVEMDSANIIRVNDQFDAYITNTNKILEAGIDANTNLFREGADSPYANIIVTASSRKDDPALLKLVAALQTEEVREYIEEQYKGAVIPAF